MILGLVEQAGENVEQVYYDMLPTYKCEAFGYYDVSTFGTDKDGEITHVYGDFGEAVIGKTSIKMRFYRLEHLPALDVVL